MLDMLQKLIFPVSLAIFPLCQPAIAQDTVEAEKTNKGQKNAFQLRTQKHEALPQSASTTNNPRPILRGNVDSAASPLNVTQRKKGLPAIRFKEISPTLAPFQNKKVNLRAEDSKQRFPLNAETERAILKPQTDFTKIPARVDKPRPTLAPRNAQAIKNKELHRPLPEVDAKLQKRDATIDFPTTQQPESIKFPSVLQPTVDLKPINEKPNVQIPELRLKSPRTTAMPHLFDQDIPSFKRKNNLLEDKDVNGELLKRPTFEIPDFVRKTDASIDVPHQKEEFVKGDLLKQSSKTVPNFIERTDTEASIIPHETETDLKGELRKLPTLPAPTIGRELNLEAHQLRKLPEAQIAEPAKLRTVFKKLVLKPQPNFEFRKKSDGDDDGISWDEWFTRLGQLSEPLLLKWCAFYGNPSGKSTVDLTVCSDHSVSAKIISGEDPLMNKATIDGFCALSGDERLKFPEGSRRNQITIEVDNEHELEGDISDVETKTIRGEREFVK